MKSAVIGMATGLISLVIAASLLNYFVLIPVYANAFGWDAVMAMAQKAMPVIGDLKSLILIATVPFNLLKGSLCCVITFFLYKRISPLLHL